MASLWAFNKDVGADRVKLEGLRVEAIDGTLGNVADTITEENGDTYLIVSTSKVPLVGKMVVLPAGLVTAIVVDEEYIGVDRMEDEIKNAPEYDAKMAKDPSFREAIERHYSSVKPQV